MSTSAERVSHDPGRTLDAAPAHASSAGVVAAVLTVGSFTLLVKLSQIAKDLVVADRFGTQDVLDAFLIALALPLFCAGAMRGALHSAFVPRYVALRDGSGREAAQRLFGSVLVRWIGLYVLVVIALQAGGAWLVPLLGSGFTGEKLALTLELFRVLVFFIVLDGASALCAATLNADSRFALPATAPASTPLLTVLLLLLFVRPLGAYALVYGMLGGALLELLLLLTGLRRLGLRPWKHRSPPDAETRRVGRDFAALVGGAALMSSNLLVDHAMAASLGPGSVASLSYGSKVVMAALGLGGMALGTAVLPHFSRLAAAREWSDTRATLARYARVITLGSVAATIVLVLASRPLVRLLFEHGAFAAADTTLVSSIQVLYLLQIPFYMLGIVGARMLNALGLARIVLLVSGVNFAVNLLGNLILMRLMGVAGIALSTSIVYAISTALVLGFARRALRRLEDGRA